MPEYTELRRRMVNNQLRTFDVTDHRVQDAMLTVARERFVPKTQIPIAYSDEDIPIVTNEIGRPVRTMTPPATFARLLQLARILEDDVVLLIGAGLGYGAAVLGQLAGSVIALESDQRLADEASANLEAADVTNAVVVVGPLPEGYASEAPYDQILIDGAVLTRPDTLLGQLKVGGRLTTVEGEGLAGRAKLYTRGDNGISVRGAFNAAAQVLPGFVPQPTFQF